MSVCPAMLIQLITGQRTAAAEYREWVREEGRLAGERARGLNAELYMIEGQDPAYLGLAAEGMVSAYKALGRLGEGLTLLRGLQHRYPGLDLLDLVQEGNVGLLQAIERFDPDVGVRLPTYAAWWVRAYIIKFLLDNVRLVRVGTTNARRKLLRNLRQLSAQTEIIVLAEALTEAEGRAAVRRGAGEHGRGGVGECGSDAGSGGHPFHQWRRLHLRGWHAGARTAGAGGRQPRPRAP